jgi:hypothetical protein
MEAAVEGFLSMTRVYVGGVLLVCSVAILHAQELPKEGKFSVTFTSVNPDPAKPVSLGDREVAIGSPIITAVNDAESGFLHAMAGRCNVLVDHNQKARTYEARGYCNLADRGGDQIYMEFTTTAPAAIGGPSGAKGKLVGGTGRFAGLSGEFDVRRSPVLASESLVISAGKLIGTYAIRN